MGELVVLTPETCDHYGKLLGPKTVPVRARMSKWLQCHQERSDYSVRKSAKSLLRHWDGLFTFLEVGGVEPTNNPAEGAPRPVVQWRKI
ncbi:MAG: transposase [Desulfomonilaceae bacterium]